MNTWLLLPQLCKVYVVCPACTLRVVSVHDVCVIHCSLYSVVDTVVYMIVCMFIDVLVCMNMYKCICNDVHCSVLYLPMISRSQSI